MGSQVFFANRQFVRLSNWRVFLVLVTAIPCQALTLNQAHAQASLPTTDKNSEMLLRLTHEGLSILPNRNEKLPPPLLVPGQTAQERGKLLEDISGASGWQRFSRNSPVAPIAIDVDYIKDASDNRIGHRIHVVFAVHAALSKFRDRHFMNLAFGRPEEQQKPEEFRFEELSRQELKETEIEIKDEKTEAYAFVEVNLLDRVQARGVIRAQTVDRGDSLVVAWWMDPRFAKHAQRGNSWSKLVAAENGQRVAQGSQTYSGCGGYVSLTQLDPASEVVLIESWTLLHEPTEWFQGSNLLRSKLPLSIQESIRTFRRKLDNSR